MTFNFHYTAEDFREATAAQVGFFAGRTPGKKRSSRLAVSLLGWVVFIALATALLFMLSRPLPSGRPTPVATPVATPDDFPQNLLIGILLPCIAPLLTLAWICRFSARPARRVPFFKPALQRGQWSVLCLRVGGWVCLVAAVADVFIVCIFGPTTMRWRPSVLQLVLVQLIPWAAWVVLATIALKLWRSRHDDQYVHPESSRLSKQRIEADDQRLIEGNDFCRTEFAWRHFVSYLETANLLLLFTRDFTVVIAPKRAFLSEKEMNAFFSLVQRNIATGRMLPRPSAFPVAGALTNPASSEAPLPVLPLQEETPKT